MCQFCSQFLALDTDAAKLQPTNIPISTYSLPPRGEGALDAASLKLTGPQTFLQSISQIMEIFETACNSLLSNETLMADIGVRLFSICPWVCSDQAEAGQCPHVLASGHVIPDDCVASRR